MGTNTAQICPVDTPESEPILVSLERLHCCPEEVGDELWGKRHKVTHQTREGQVRPPKPQPSDLVEESAATRPSLSEQTAEESIQESTMSFEAEGSKGTGSGSSGLEKEVVAENSSAELLVEGELPDIHSDFSTITDSGDFGMDKAREDKEPLLTTTSPREAVQHGGERTHSNGDYTKGSDYKNQSCAG